MTTAKYEYLYNSKETTGKYQTSILLKHFTNLSKLDVLEIGIGNATKRAEFAKSFNSYTGIEPDNELFNLSVTANSNIIMLNIAVEQIDTSKQYDVVIFMNSFHFLNLETTADVLSKIVKIGGIVLIEEPFILPTNWGSDKLNASSIDFDVEMWQYKRTKLKTAKKFLLENMNNNFKVSCYGPQKYVLIRNS